MPLFAAVDIGSNSVRLKIARLSGRRFHALHEDREVTRLGESVFRTGFLSPETMAGTIKVLRRFHRACQRLGTDSVRVVATSALRDARNSHAFLEWVRSATGWTVEIISGLEEARLIHLGLVSSLKVGRAPVLMIDLGGGSCELTISVVGHIRETVSLPLGAVRLTNDFLHHDPARKAELESLRGFIARELRRVSSRIIKLRVATVIATSGTAASLAAVCQVLSKNEASSVTRPQMRRIAKLIARSNLEQRRRMNGIGPRRAEIIVAGAIVYSELLEQCHLRGFRYSPLGLRDGLLAQMAAEHDRGTRSGRQIESERWDSLQAALAHYRVDAHHALQVRESAMTLFDGLKVVHSLPAEYREWLSAAAMLYEVGDYVNRSGRHRHTYYIISHSEILGYTPEQRRTIAAIARYLGKSRPSPSDAAIKALLPQHRQHVPKASELLRLARALNLGRTHSLRDLRVRMRNAEVQILLYPARGGGIELELWALEKEKNYFRELFGRTLSPMRV
ncbi:MAG: Ppx/GppA family phosphatase [Acidobacteria bacterium]|nr:Ppx/GppA family phosphatase [Acidobacteriota bacterium]MBV9480777.1 Ppx/GppA family phosphatase [Acidobacteriota bacterium]